LCSQIYKSFIRHYPIQFCSGEREERDGIGVELKQRRLFLRDKRDSAFQAGREFDFSVFVDDETFHSFKALT
jgi:hypothetical protein